MYESVRRRQKITSTFSLLAFWNSKANETDFRTKDDGHEEVDGNMNDKDAYLYFYSVFANTTIRQEMYHFKESLWAVRVEPHAIHCIWTHLQSLP